MMSVKSIYDKLGAKGYFVKLLQDDWMVIGKITEPLEGYPNISQMDFYCDVSLEEGGKYRIAYGGKNEQPTVLVPSESEVINWIKKQYPLS
jgi:hypothetical protein